MYATISIIDNDNNSVDVTPSRYHLSNFLCTEETWELYLERMEKDKEWGSHIEVIAIADVLSVPIQITNDSSDYEDFQVWI